MNIVFTPTAWEQYTEWKREDKKMMKRINELIKEPKPDNILMQGSLRGLKPVMEKQ